MPSDALGNQYIHVANECSLVWFDWSTSELTVWSSTRAFSTFYHRQPTNLSHGPIGTSRSGLNRKCLLPEYSYHWHPFPSSFSCTSVLFSWLVWSMTQEKWLELTGGFCVGSDLGFMKGCVSRFDSIGFKVSCFLYPCCHMHVLTWYGDMYIYIIYVDMHMLPSIAFVWYWLD